MVRVVCNVMVKVMSVEKDHLILSEGFWSGSKEFVELLSGVSAAGGGVSHMKVINFIDKLRF